MPSECNTSHLTDAKPAYFLFFLLRLKPVNFTMRYISYRGDFVVLSTPYGYTKLQAFFPFCHNLNPFPHLHRFCIPCGLWEPQCMQNRQLIAKVHPWSTKEQMLNKFCDVFTLILRCMLTTDATKWVMILADITL